MLKTRGGGFSTSNSYFKKEGIWFHMISDLWRTKPQLTWKPAVIKLLQEHAKTTEKEMQNLLARVPGIGTTGRFEGWMAVAEILNVEDRWHSYPFILYRWLVQLTHWLCLYRFWARVKLLEATAAIAVVQIWGSDGQLRMGTTPCYFILLVATEIWRVEMGWLW